jgi:hypothetical protein
VNGKVCGIALAALFLVVPRGDCQWKELPSTGSPTERLPDRTTLVGQSGLGPLLIAKLVDEERNAKKHKAIVVVQTDGVQLVDPVAAHHHAKIDEAHIQYQLDEEPAQDSVLKTWTFAQLSPGEHEIHVALATSDNHRIGKEKRLHLRVP